MVNDGAAWDLGHKLGSVTNAVKVFDPQGNLMEVIS